MTNAAYNFGTAPEWDKFDRLRKTLRVAGMTGSQMAEYLGVTHESVSGWLNAKHEPSKSNLKLWALRTGVPYEWIETGECTPRDLNPEPTDSGLRSNVLPFTRSVIAA